MATKIRNGQLFRTRNSNHLYSQLDDLDTLKELLRQDCPADVARSLDVPYNSLRFVIVTYFTEEEQDQIKWKRKRHSNKRIVK